MIESMLATPGPVIADICEDEKENCYPMIPSVASHNEMILRPAGDARHFLLGTASLSVLSYEHNPEEPVIKLWNDTRHVLD